MGHLRIVAHGIVFQVGLVWCGIRECPVIRRSIVTFFFSSRRRHTRLQGDWSSDVCSSDLPINKRGQRNTERLEMPLEHWIDLARAEDDRQCAIDDELEGAVVATDHQTV